VRCKKRRKGDDLVLLLMMRNDGATTQNGGGISHHSMIHGNLTKDGMETPIPNPAIPNKEIIKKNRARAE